MAQVTQEFADVDVKDQSGAASKLGATWAARPAVLVFVRHFG
jgi:hypothetical protein